MMSVFVKETLLLVFVCTLFASASAVNQQTCDGLDQLIQNTNPDLLSGCARDSNCTKMTCQPNGNLANLNIISSIIFELKPCEMQPGVNFMILQTAGGALIDQLITSPTQITHSLGLASAIISVFVNSTSTDLGLAVDPVTLATTVFGTSVSSSAFLVSFTSISLDKSKCPTAAVTDATPAVNQQTCDGLDQLIQNTNPDLLSGCARDSNCTKMTCQPNGNLALGNALSSITFELKPCEMQPGVNLMVLQTAGGALIDQLITSPTQITRSLSLGSAVISVFVNSTSTDLGLAVDPLVLTSALGTSSAFLVSFTSISLDTSVCQTVTTTGQGQTTDSGTSAVTDATPTTAGATTGAASEKEKTTDSGTSVTAADMDTCAGLELLGMNTNSDLFTNCVRDDACTTLTCQATQGLLSTQIDSFTITLEPCETGIRIALLKSGKALLNMLITKPTNITQVLGPATVNATVFVNSTDKVIGISVDPVTVFAELLGVSTNSTLISFTKVPINKSSCKVDKGAGQITRISLWLFPLTLLALFINLSYFVQQ